MTLIAEDVTFAIGEDVEFALPMFDEAVGGDISEWLASAGLSEADIEASVGTWLSNMGSGALNFGTAGASIGGPWGALIGGLLGAGLGAVQSATTPDNPPANQPQPKPAPASSPPPAATPAKPPPSGQSQGQPDMTTVLNAIRDLMPALTAIAQQMSRPKTEAAEDDESESADVALPDVAEDWSLEQDWPYAQEGVEVAAPEEAETEEPEGEPETGQAETEAAAEQLVPEGEAYAGAALSRAGEAEQEEAEVA